MKKTALFAGAALAVIVSTALIGLRISGKGAAAGFLGPGSLVADVNLALEVLLVLGLTLGMALARRGRIEAHRINQTVWVLVNSALVACIMVPSLRNAQVKRIADLASLPSGLPWLHALVGAFTIVAGLWLVLQMNDVLPERWHLHGWKTLMRATLAGYWAVALLGIAVYYAWNVA
jgi:hypothetical protein